jgi:hypothetical protein
VDVYLLTKLEINRSVRSIFLSSDILLIPRLSLLSSPIVATQSYINSKDVLFLLFIKKEIGHLQAMNLSLNEEPMNRSIYLYIR